MVYGASVIVGRRCGWFHYTGTSTVSYHTMFVLQCLIHALYYVRRWFGASRCVVTVADDGVWGLCDCRSALWLVPLHGYVNCLIPHYVRPPVSYTRIVLCTQMVWS